MNRFFQRAMQLLIVMMMLTSAVSSQPKMDKVVVNGALYDHLFDNDNDFVSSGGVTVGVIKNVTTGKADSVGPTRVEYKVINCKIRDTGRNHYGFDNCIAYTYLSNDSLVLQFQNNNINIPKFNWWDRLVVHIIDGKFYAEYVYTSRSTYQLQVISQKLILQKWTKTKGEQIKGELVMQCANQISGWKIPKTVTFRGFFNATIQ